MLPTYEEPDGRAPCQVTATARPYEPPEDGTAVSYGGHRRSGNARRCPMREVYKLQEHAPEIDLTGAYIEVDEESDGRPLLAMYVPEEFVADLIARGVLKRREWDAEAQEEVLHD